MWPVAWTARGDGASSFKDRRVREQQVAKVPFAEHDNKVDALAADRAYQPFPHKAKVIAAISVDL
jgi:hypothetical protein